MLRQARAQAAKALLPGLEPRIPVATARAPYRPPGAMRNSLDLEGRPRGHPCRRRHVRRRRFVGDGCAVEVARATTSSASRCSSTTMARRPIARAPAAPGSDIHDARDVAAAHRHSALRARLREPLPRGGDRQFRRQLCARARRRCRASSAIASIKFRDLLETARELGAAALATGHYVASRRLRRRLARAASARADADRDQSYFLFATTREQLDYLRFPLGDMTKPRGARAGAPLRPRRSPTSRTARTSASCRPAATPTSSAGCGRMRWSPATSSISPAACSAAIDGICHFTVGQRKGLGIAAGEPLFVVRLDADSAPRRGRPARGAARCDRIVLRDVNWIGDGALDRAIGEGIEMFVRVRSTRAAAAGVAARGARRLRGRTRRRRGGRLARPGLRVLRRAVGAGARARRRLHQSASAKRRRAARSDRGRVAEAVARLTQEFRAGDGGHQSRPASTKAYDRWAPVYDLVFGKVFDEGRRSTIAEADRIGGRVLDVGVGTGLSLSDYSRSTKLCGVDISEAMLRKAQAARARARPHQCRDARGDGRQASRLRRRLVRRGGRAICHHRGAGSRRRRSTTSSAC